MNPLEAREKFNQALQEYITHEYGPDQWLGDYVVSAQILDMREGAHPGATIYMHFGKGPFHSQRGLTVEQHDWLDELKEEERKENER